MKSIILALLMVLNTQPANPLPEAENTGVVPCGYYGVDGWVTTKLADFEISERTALAIANDVFNQICHADYLEQTEVYVNETDDCYIVFRGYPNELTDDGKLLINISNSLEIIIRKSDGKVIRIEAGE